MVTRVFLLGTNLNFRCQSYPGRAEEISNEWEAPTRNLVQSKDPDVFALLTNPVYKLPSMLPDGVYSPVTPEEPPLEDIPPVDEAPIDEDPAPPVDDPDNERSQTIIPLNSLMMAKLLRRIHLKKEKNLKRMKTTATKIPLTRVRSQKRMRAGRLMNLKFSFSQLRPITIGPLAGAVQFVEGWFYSSWFGVFRIDEGPDPSWVYHVQLGWI